eukprot:Sspe_Gene.59897::Locus_32940_Transcript_1_4_Confidence_0.400_Length_1415::g.59897::m.59897
MVDQGIERTADLYSGALLTQDIDTIGSMMALEVYLTGLQCAAGRLEVMKKLMKAFKWYCIGELVTEVKNVRERERNPVKGEDSSGHVRRGDPTPEEKKAEPESVVDVGWAKGPVAMIDTITVGSDGRIVAVHRQKGQPPPNLTEQQKHKMEAAWTELIRCLDLQESSSASPRRKRIDNTNDALQLPVLDFSYREISHPKHILRTDPRSGQQFKPKIVARPETQPQQPVQAEKPPPAVEGEEDILVVRAKNREGEQTAYSWDRSEMKLISAMTEELKDGSAVGTLEGPARYMTNSVKLCNNQLTDISLLGKALRLTVHHSMVFLTFLDLSCNCVSVLPDDLDDFPLQVLYLHSNNIGSFSEVKKLSKIATLHSLTLWNNPIENKNPATYKMQCLNLLTPRSPGQGPTLRKLDHAVISKADLQNCRMFREFNSGRTRSKTRGGL